MTGNEALPADDLRAPADIHRHFAALVGSDHIAKEYAIEGLVSWLRRRAPSHVLGVGSGIGTLTWTTISTLDEVHGEGAYQLVEVEDNEFCLEMLSSQLGRHLLKCRVISNGEIPTDLAPEFVVIDGGGCDQAYFRHLAPRGVVFVEGSREPQRSFLESFFSDRAWVRANFRPAGSGGYWVYQFEPTLPERVWFRSRGLLNWCRGMFRRLRSPT